MTVKYMYLYTEKKSRKHPTQRNIELALCFLCVVLPSRSIPFLHLQVTKNSASYWEGKSDAESLQRVYGISFPDPKMLKEWKHFQEEAAKRDHRKIGMWRKRGTCKPS